MSESNTYEDNVALWKQAYQEILDTCKKYPDFDSRFGFDDIRNMVSNAKNHLLLIEWYEKYGIKISHDHNLYPYHYIKFSEYLSFSRFNDAEQDKEQRSGKYISWSDDGRQPKNEWLLVINFPTGPYIFGKDYDGQTELFQDFITELKTYNPDYSDSANKSFYWKLDNAKKIFDEFNEVLRKYHSRNQSELKRRQADKMRKELEKLEAEL